MNKIHVLPDNVANQIAAGEVINRPASCVKELIENSMDAGAGDIRVRIEMAGKKLIEVIDDGCGMSGADAKTAFLRHATSKITSAEDLKYIQSFGFRGEALASVSSVARVEVITKTGDDDAAVKLLLENSRVISEEKTASNKGTTISIKNLFYNTPARKKFLKTDYTEEAHIIEAVTSAGFANEGVALKLILDDKEVVNFPAGTDIRERVRIIQGKEVSSGLIELGEFTDNIKITGYISEPRTVKNNRSGQYFFVNNRLISHRRLNYAVYEGYGTLLMKGKYPYFYIFIDINPSMIDVNVHPAKAEIKFREEGRVYNMLKGAVEKALKKAELSIKPDGIKTTDSAEFERRAFDTVKELVIKEQGGLFEGAEISLSKAAEKPVSVESVSRPGLSINVFGQANKTYIVGEDSDNLVIIDQHAAHEKILYEAIIKPIENGNVKTQELLIPEVIEVTPAEKKLIENNTGIFEKTGFFIEQFGENEYKVTAHPVIIKEKACAPFIKEITGHIAEKGNASPEEVLKDIAATIACRAAVKAGDELNHKEIESLLAGYFEINEPYSCPHGRPPVVKISFEELEKMFKRKL